MSMKHLRNHPNRLLERTEGQAALEFIVTSGVMLIILLALASLWGSWQGGEVSEDSMFERSVLESPYTINTSLGLSAQGVRDILEH